MKRNSKIILISSIIAISIFFSVAYFQSNVTIVERCIGDTVYKDFTGEIVHRETCILPFTGKKITDTLIGCDQGFKQIDNECLPEFPSNYTQPYDGREPIIYPPIEELEEQLQLVLNYCNDTSEMKFAIGFEYYNKTHYINNSLCEWQKIEKYPNTDIDCIPNQNKWVTGEEIRNQTHIYDKQNCLWEQVWDGYSHPFGMKEYEKEHYQIEITGLKDVYLIGESYSFSYVISGYGYPCADYESNYPDENGNILTRSTLVQCDTNQTREIFEIVPFEEIQEIQIKNIGEYTVTVSFDKPSKQLPTVIKKKFTVVENYELYGCADNEIYDHGICMTLETKEKVESIGENED